MNKLLLRTNLENQKKATKTRDKEFESQSKKTVAELNKFYLYITSLSSGAIVISITFLGNLIDKIKIIEIFFFGRHINLLFIAWIALFISIFTGLIRIFSHINYEYFAEGSSMMGERVRLAEIELEYAEKIGVANPKEYSKEEFQKDIENKQNTLSEMSKKENYQFTLSKICERISRICFVLGILFLIFFGIISLSAVIV